MAAGRAARAGRRRRHAPSAGYYLGWVAQPVGILLGLLTAPMFVVGEMFLGLWVLGFVLGKRLDNRPESPAPA